MSMESLMGKCLLWKKVPVANEIIKKNSISISVVIL
jgi:hypothetical protein